MPIRSALVARPTLTTILTTNGAILDELDRTLLNPIGRLTCIYALRRTSRDPVSKFGNRVSCKGPWVQIPSPPLEVFFCVTVSAGFVRLAWEHVHCLVGRLRA